MPYLESFEPDIFISYSHIDDESFGEDQKKWVSEFHRNLETRIRILLGSGVAVWRDPKLRGNDIFADEIRRKVADSGVLVSIISPGYLNSEWCTRELQTFVEASEARGGCRVGGHSRIFKVLKTPVPLQKQTSLLRSVLGYDFFKIDQQTGKTRELLLDPSPEARASYWTRLDDVAQDIASVFALLSTKGSQNPDPANCVYVAETTSDLRDKRDSLIRELTAHGYTPVPDLPLPLDSEDLVESIRTNLQLCRLSVHLVGARYGVVPEGESRSLVEVQNQLAADHFNGSNSRQIWIPKDVQAREEAQARFLTDLRMNHRLLHGAEVLETSFEDFKTNLFHHLSARPKDETAVQSDAPAQMYIVCDKQDRPAVAPIRQRLFDAGFEVLLPLVEGDAAEIREDHTENLKIADAILIYWGIAPEPWFRAKLRDLLQMRAIRGSKPLPVQAVYLSAPATLEKLEFQTRQATVMRSFEQFDPTILTPFISDVKSRVGVTV